MAWEEDEIDASSDDEYVPVVFARSLDEAEELRQLLEDHGIEAVLGDESDAAVAENSDTTIDAISHGVAVLVPDMYLDEASEIIADREDADEFEPEDEEEGEEEDDDEFPLGGEVDEDGFFQIEEEDDDDESLDDGEIGDGDDDDDDDFLSGDDDEEDVDDDEEMDEEEDDDF